MDFIISLFKSMPLRRIRHKYVTGGDGTALPVAAGLLNGGADRIRQGGVGWHMYDVQSGDQSHGIAQGRRVHIMLDHVIRHSDVANGQLVRQGTGHAGVDDLGGTEAQDHSLGTHGRTGYSGTEAHWFDRT